MGKYVQIQPWVLVAVSLWAILHDRPAEWACEEANWATAGRLRPWRLPSPATMSRRAYEVAVGCFWRLLEGRLRELKRQWDSDNVFTGTHNIPPAEVAHV